MIQFFDLPEIKIIDVRIKKVDIPAAETLGIEGVE